MKNFVGRFKFIVLLSIILFLYAMGIQVVQSRPLEAALVQQEIRGIVTDKEGNPIGGVTVLIKGEDQGTTTNFDGEYTISAGPADILVFSYLGFQTQEVAVNTRNEIDIILEEDITALNEVEINAGYYNTTRRESTGNISRVTAEEIEMQPVISPLQALQGRMAGVEIIPGGSHPGMAPTIRIRGRNSLREEGNYPLYIIDGVPVNSNPVESHTLVGNRGIDPLNTLSTSNIESIEILKDADATAIYGSRGANGVVLITTKRGKYQKKGMEARIYTGTSRLPNRIEMLNTQQYLRIRREAFENDGVEPTVDNAYDLVLWDQSRYTDWQDLFYGGTSEVQSINLSANGGSGTTFFRLDGAYHKQGTIFPGEQNYNRISAGLNLNHRSKDDKFSMDLSVNYGLDHLSSVGDVNLSSAVFRLAPNAPRLFNEDGSLHWEEWTEAGQDNPLKGFFNTGQIKSNNLVSSLSIGYEFLPGLKLMSNFGFTRYGTRELLKRPKRSYDPFYWETRDHSSSNLATFRESWIIEPQLNYTKELGKATLTGILGGTIQENNSMYEEIQGEGYVSESLIGTLSAAEEITHAASHNTEYRYAALFARLGLDWDKKYYLNLTGRRDGSSRFGPGKKLANFWAVGGAWIFTEESFFAPDDFLSFGKLRASFGTSGSDQIGDYKYLDAYESTYGPDGLYPTRLYNSEYSWEVNKKIEAAVDLGFNDNLVRLSLSWYRNRSSNQLVGYPLPSITGFNSVQANLPATVENTGIEVELSTTNIQTEKFSWDTYLNYTLPENRLIEYPNIEQSSYANRYKVGHPLNISLLYLYEGLDPDTGFYSVKDVNEDGRFDYKDRTVIQDLGREFFGGIRNNMNYGNFSLQFLLDFVKQKGTLHLFNAGTLSNQRVEVINALEEDSKFQRISQLYPATTAYSRVLNSEFSVVDASFLRLRSISFGYTLPTSLLERIALTKGQIFLNGENIFTLTSYKGMDPELPDGGTQFSNLRTITAGIQVQL